jgi:hypothetical protein
MLDWDDMAALEAALGSEIGQRTTEDAAANLARYATFRGMILQLDEGLIAAAASASGCPHRRQWPRRGLALLAASARGPRPNVLQY